MIIKLTVHDNDFSDWLVSYAKQMFYYRRNTKPVSEMTSEEKAAEVDRILAHDDIFKMVNPNTDEKITNEKATKIIKYIREEFEAFLINKKVGKSTREYLLRELTITIQKSFTDRWENGEAIYWFQHSNQVINQ
jgi:hypothetical protein